MLIGAYFSKFIISDGLEIALALFLIIMSLVFLIFKTIVIKPSKKNSIIGGILSGGFAGLVGTGGAIRGITLTSFKLPTEVFIATSAVIDLGVDSGRAVVYWFNGYILWNEMYLIPLLAIASVVGTYIGKKILKKISEEKFRVIVLVLIVVTGSATLFKVFFN